MTGLLQGAKSSCVTVRSGGSYVLMREDHTRRGCKAINQSRAWLGWMTEGGGQGGGVRKL